jgi:hypothetical protein
MDENQTVEQIGELPAAPAANLSLQDLLLVAQTIQVVAQRGVFRAEEMSNIGALYDRIIAFLTASGALKPAEEATTEGQEDSTAPVTDPVTDTQGE